MQIWLVTFTVTALRGNLGKFAFNVETAPLSGSSLLLSLQSLFAKKCCIGPFSVMDTEITDGVQKLS